MKTIQESLSAIFIFNFKSKYKCKVGFYLFIYLGFYVAFNSLGHIATGSFTGGGNQCMLHCKPPGIGKSLPTFQHEAPGKRFEPAASEVGGENSTTTPPSPLM